MCEKILESQGFSVLNTFLGCLAPRTPCQLASTFSLTKLCNLVRGVDCKWPLYSSNNGEEGKTSKCEHHCKSSDAHATSGLRSQHRCSHVTLTFMSYPFTVTLVRQCLVNIVLKYIEKEIYFFGPSSTLMDTSKENRI